MLLSKRGGFITERGIFIPQTTPEKPNYDVNLTVTNAYGNDNLTRSGYVTVTEPGTSTWTTITYDDFESGFGNYTDGGGDCFLYTSGTYANQGSNAGCIQDNSGTASSFYHKIVTIPKAQYGYPSNAKLRFMCDASGNADDVYIDELEFRGFGGGGTTPTPPVADFAGDPTSGVAPLVVNFTDLSTGSPTSWSWTFGDGGTSTAQNPSYSYGSAGTYTVALTATNGDGSDAATKTGYITVTEGSTGGWEVITYDDFEGGMGNYTDGGSDMSRYTSGTYAYEGSAAANIQDNSGVSSSFYHTSGYNVSRYVDLEVEFYFLTISMENGENFWVQYYNGSSWLTIANFVASVDFSNNQFYVTTLNIPTSSYNYPTNAKLRFMCDASNNGDDVYIDAIEFRGLTAGGASMDQMAEVFLPEKVELKQNFPNPFNPMTEIKFSLPAEGQVSLKVFNIRGEVVSTLVSEVRGAGEHSVIWDAREHPSGVYFYRVEIPGFSETKKMTMLK